MIHRTVEYKIEGNEEINFIKIDFAFCWESEQEVSEGEKDLA